MAVDVATDGQDALESLAVTRYDVVVLDRDLPGTHSSAGPPGRAVKRHGHVRDAEDQLRGVEWHVAVGKLTGPSFRASLHTRAGSPRAKRAALTSLRP